MTVSRTKDDGSTITLQIVSYNVLCLPKGSSIRPQGFDEVAEGACFPAAVPPGNGSTPNHL